MVNVNDDIPDLGTTLPQGCSAAPLFPGESSEPVRLCAVLRESKGGGRAPVVLQHTDQAQVLLGCLLDAGGTVHRWLEIRIQRAGQASVRPTTLGDELSNRSLDDQWARFAEAAWTMDREGVVRTGYEARHPLPTFVQPDAKGDRPAQTTHLIDGNSGAPWELCRDDAVLEAAGLPPYNTSLHRYLFNSGNSQAIIPATEDAPTTERTRPLREAVPGADALVPLNPAGGLLLVRQFDPVTLDAFLDAVRAGALPGETAHAGGAGQPNGVLAETGSLFMGRANRGVRLLESLHLTLRSLMGAIMCVRELTSQTQTPMLNLRPESFRVRLWNPGSAAGAASGGLPSLWTATTVLVEPGGAITVPIPASSASYFLRPNPAEQSIYEPTVGSNRAISGFGRVRIRQVVDDKGGGSLIEGTFAANERIAPIESDLLWLRFNADGREVNVHAHFDEGSALAGGEWRFRSIAKRFDGDMIAALRGLEGRELPQVQFQILPLLSSPCDLYALGVLAVRMLLLDAGTTLAKAVDELHSLGREVAHSAGESKATLSERIAEAMGRDQRFLQAIGPHRLAAEEIEPAVAFELVPGSVWWDLLAAIMRMFPGLAPESVCRDYGDARPGAMHRVYDEILNDLGTLLLRTRSLIAVDWASNREIHAVLRQHMQELTGAELVMG